MGASVVPKMRAGLAKDLLDAVGGLEAEAVRRIRAAVPGYVLGEIERSIRLDWIDYEHGLRLNDATLVVLGEERFRALRKRVTSLTTRSPFLATVLSGAFNLFARSPRRVFQLSARAYRLLSRDAGQITSEDHGDREVRLVYGDMPALIVESRAWRLSIVVDHEAVLDMFKQTGEVRLLEYDVERGAAVLSIRWET